MSTKRRKKLVHEGKYAAEVEIELLEDAGGWEGTSKSGRIVPPEQLAV